ncbi:IS200/IS605 family transposase [Fibrella arboris]|uniref:IS200/IS605 family transposase n=1 Tax=Fibrella arboris TaxID=3242486 RepID=UPI003521D78F
MPSTYTQLYVQIVFAVKGRQNLISRKNKEELHQYITGIIQNKGAKLLAIHAMSDHIHLFIGFGPTLTIADLVRDLKANSTRFVKDKGWSPHFAWQEGYGAFTYGQSQVSDVIQYVLNQEQHHHKRTFQEEYILLLERFNVNYDQKYVFEFYDQGEVASEA